MAIKLKAEDRPIRVFFIGGGLKSSCYPPPAFREYEIRWGLPLMIESRKFQLQHGMDGRSSNEYLPIFMVGVGEVPDRLGFFAGLEWSGTWQAAFFWSELEKGVFQIKLGTGLSNIVIAPGERVDLPPVHLGLFEGDFEMGTNVARRYIYNQICPDLEGQRPMPPISYDHWYGIKTSYDEIFIRKQVDRAAQMKLEYFVLDAGWYSDGPTTNNLEYGVDSFEYGVGNWRCVDSVKFPNGLEPLAKYVKSKGLKFGLFFEVERARRGSDLHAMYPEWFFDIGGQWVHLNMALPKVQDYIIEMIGSWIERLDLRWIRWDYNIGPLEFWQHADLSGKIQLHYMEGLYRVLDMFRRKYPQLLIECCASGGRRIDLGMLKRMHTCWFSDHAAQASVCRIMQTRANRFLPGNLLNSGIPTWRGMQRKTISDNEILNRMCGAVSISGDLTGWSDAAIQRMQKMVKIYKSIRHLLLRDFYRLTHQPYNDSDWDVVQFHDPQVHEGLVFAFRVAGYTEKRQISFKALERSRRYVVRDVLSNSEQTLSGEQLMSSGWEFTLPMNGAALLHYHMTK